MSPIEPGIIIGAIVEMAIETGWDKARKHQVVQRILRKLDIDFDPSSADFDDIYTYTLVSFGMGKPRRIIEIFCQPPIRHLLRQAFDTGDRRLVEEEARKLIDWPVLEKLLVEFDVSPEPLMREFLDCFEDAVDRARTAVEVRYERKIDQLISGQEQLPQQISQQFFPQFEEIKALLLQTSPLEDAQLERLSKEKAYDKQIDQARDLIQEDKAGAAQSLLKKLEIEFQDRETSTGLRFRLLTNLGASFLLLGEDAQAASYFERALDYALNDPKALSNAALAAFMHGDFKLAIKRSEQALEIQPDHPSALSVWIQALAKAEKLDQLDQETRALIERDVESRRALAFVLIDTEEYEQAEKLLRLSVESGESDPQDLALLAQAILAPIQITWWENPPLPWNISPDEIARLEEAETLLTQVVDAWALIENRRRFHSALVSRVSARALQGKFESAAQDCQRILSEDPTHPQAVYNSGLLALQMENYAEAIKHFERCLVNPLQQESTRLPLAVARLKNGQPRNALEMLLQEEGNDGEQEMSIRLEKLILIAQAAQTLGETAQLSEVVEQLCALPQDDPLILETLASVELIQQRADNAIEHLQEALEFAEGNLKNRITLQLAEIYYRQRQFDKAIPLYETVVPTNRDSPPTRDYVVSLLNSGNWNQAYDLAREIRSGGDVIPVISEVEARIAESIGDLEPALHLYTELAKLEPDNPEHFLRVASIHIRSGKPERAATFLDQVVKRFWSDPWALLSLVKSYRLHVNKCLKKSYRPS